MTRKNTKRALVSSAVSLTLCCSMLVGSTFAWFTDSAASGSNVIKSGNLDIEVQYTLDGEKWHPLDGADNLFQKGFWEPGHTEVVALKIENKGSLALKYAANMNIVEEEKGRNKAGDEFALSDILTVSTLVQQANDAMGVGDITLGLAFNGENSVKYENTDEFKDSNVLRDNVELYPGDAHYVIVKADMDETVGNEANHNGEDVPSIEFGINVLATQFTYENDSYGNQYDKDASTDDVMIEKSITLTEDQTEAMEIGEKEAVEFNMGGNTLSSTLTNNGKVVVSNGSISTPNGATGAEAVGFQNYGDAKLTDVSMTAGSASDYGNILYAGSTTVYENVSINSKGGGIGVRDGAKATFNSGSVYVDSASTSARYLFYVIGNGSELTINDGTFSWDKNDNQKRAYIYVGSGATVYVNGGTFGPASTRNGYTAGILGEGTVIITGGTFGFDPSAWVAEGYTATESDGTWTVSAN